MSENSNLPWIQTYIDMTLNDHQMLQKMIYIFQQIGASVIEKTITQNSFIVIKKNTNFIQDICSIFFGPKTNTPKIQVVFRFLENQYNRLVEIKSLQGYHNENETIIINYLKKCIPYAKNIKIVRFAPGYFSTIEDELQKEYMECMEREEKNKYNNKKRNKSMNSSRGTFLEENSNMLQKINKHANNYYEIYKILSQDNYDVGRTMTAFINEFKIKKSNNNYFLLIFLIINLIYLI